MLWRGDAKAIASLCDVEAVLLAPGSHAVVGRAAVQAWFAKDTAASDKAGEVLDTGNYLSVSVKKDGHWYYLRDTWNPDVAH